MPGGLDWPLYPEMYEVGTAYTGGLIMHACAFDTHAPAGTGGDYEVRRQKALQVLYELKFTFGMEELAREFLHAYVASTRPPPPRASRHATLITERILHRV